MIKIGDTVLCRLYNTPERKFYGEMFTGEVTGIGTHVRESVKMYQVFTKEPIVKVIWLRRKEIIKLVRMQKG